MKTRQTSMRTAFVALLLGLSLTILGCSGSVSVGGGECSYQGLELTEVTDSTGAVYSVEEVELELETDGEETDIDICGVSKEATPTEVDGKYFFTAGGGEIEAVALGRFAWHLLGAEWD